MNLKHSSVAAALAAGVLIRIYGEDDKDGEDGSQTPDAHLAAVNRWLKEYVSVPEANVGRTGPVCPFVPAALDQDAIQYSLRYDIDDDSGAEDLIRALGAELSHFAVSAGAPPRSGTSLASLITAFPRLGLTGWRRLDNIYATVKNIAVSQGLMIGQFHPVCDQRAVRNSDFPVSRSPVALCVIRRMAPHDILFLRHGRTWFGEYQDRFGRMYPAGRVRDPFLRELHRVALEVHGPVPAGVDAGVPAGVDAGVDKEGLSYS